MLCSACAWVMKSIHVISNRSTYCQLQLALFPGHSSFDCLQEVKDHNVVVNVVNGKPGKTRKNIKAYCFTWISTLQHSLPHYDCPYLQTEQFPQSSFCRQPVHFWQYGRLFLLIILGSLAPSCGWLCL